jgi:putative membrane protein
MLKGKSFGMSSHGRFILKLDEARATELAAQKIGKLLSPSPGKLRKGWIEVTNAKADWVALAKEACTIAAVATLLLPAYNAWMIEQPPPGDSQFRDHAANERTLLAWIRTGIALMAFGFAIARFGLFLREVGQVGQVHVGQGVGSAWFGVVLVVIGLLTNAAATFRYGQVRRALIEHRSAPPSSVVVYALGIGSMLVAVAMAVVLARTLSQ